MSVTRWLSEERSRPSALAGFDSTTTLVRSLSRFLHGEEFPALGLAPRSLASILPAGNRLPERVRRRLYQIGTAREAIDPDALEDVRLEAIREWVVEQYPERGYPAVLIGSTNGATVHLAALIGVPWLPQTFLLPVRRDGDPDAVRDAFEWGKRVAGPLLEANPDLQLHHMHDPNQDRLPIERMAYFRAKSLELGPAYERFLETVLSPDGTIVLLDCDLEWPTTAVSDRHVFQFGGLGGIDPEEYHVGSDRIARFLERQGASRRRWDPPEPDGERPEAEWGLEPTLGDDVARFVRSHGNRMRRLRFDHPNDPSPLVADCYRRRYEAAGIPATRLVVDTFAQVEPWWTLRTGSVPYWLSFVTEPDARSVEEYLDGPSEPYEEIYLSLFSHGVDSVGLTSIDRWRTILSRARNQGSFLGVDPDAYPTDYGTYVRYNADFPEVITDRQPLVAPMPFDRFEETVASTPRESIEWLDGPSGPDASTDQ